MKLKLILLGMLLFTGLLWSPLKAQNLLVNGSFGDNAPSPPPTSMICDVSPWGWQASVSSSYAPLTGIQWEDNWHTSWWIDISDCGWGNGRWVKQTVTTVIGQNYIIGLDLLAPAWAPSGVDLYLNGVLVAHFDNANNGNPAISDWERFEICWTATSTSTEVKLVGNSSVGSSCPVIGIDSVVMIESDSIPFEITLSDTCAPATVGFQTWVLGHSIWYYNGNFLDSGVNSVTATTPGVYSIKYITACGDTLTKDTVVVECDTCKPDVSIQGFCWGQPTDFEFDFAGNCLSPDCIEEMAIYYGDGVMEYLYAPMNPFSSTHTYASPGTYTVTYCWKNTCTNVTKCSTVVVVIVECDCSPTEDIQNLCLGQVTSFNFMFGPECEGCVGNMTIDYGDGTINSGGAPYSFNHTYPATGTYTVTYCWDDLCKQQSFCRTFTITIVECPCEPVENIQEFCLGETTIFDFDFDPDCEHCITEMTIDYGDGNTASNTNPFDFYHTYAAPGTYTVTYCWVDNCKQQMFCRTITVTIIDCTCEPVPDIRQFCLGQPTLFDLPFDPECEPCIGQMTIDFGDGTMMLAPGAPYSFQHIYASPGSYSVKYCWTDICTGLTHCRTVVIMIVRCGDGTEPAPNSVSETLDNPLSLFPNPAQNKVMLQGITPEKAVKRVEVLSIDGKLILSLPADAGKTELEIPLDKLSSGTYLVRVIGGQPTVNLKLVKE